MVGVFVIACMFYDYVLTTTTYARTHMCVCVCVNVDYKKPLKTRLWAALGNMWHLIFVGSLKFNYAAF